jgi:hypothetical protein
MSSFTPPWGTVQTDPDHPGLSTEEVINNMMLAFNRMRPFTVSEDSTTTAIEADASLILTGDVTSLTLGQGTYKGIELKIFNDAGRDVVLLGESHTLSVSMGESLALRWNGAGWRVKTDLGIGDFYEQYPDAKSPIEKGWEGVWEKWSDRAVEYGLSSSAPPAFVDYAGLIGTSIAAGATPVVCYHLPGADFRLYRFIAQSAAYSVPAVFDSVKWTYLQPGVIDGRQRCGNALVDDDYEIGDIVASGTYAGMYVTEIIVPGGKFNGVEGGNRPTFISGGVQEGWIRNITGNCGYFFGGYSQYDIGAL